MPGEHLCSFCLRPPSEIGPIVQGPDPGRGSVFICRDCAELALEILDAEQQGRQGRKPALPARLREEWIEICTGALERLEVLQEQRELTKIELERKQRVRAELKELRSEG